MDRENNKFNSKYSLRHLFLEKNQYFLNSITFLNATMGSRENRFSKMHKHQTFQDWKILKIECWLWNTDNRCFCKY